MGPRRSAPLTLSPSDSVEVVLVRANLGAHVDFDESRGHPVHSITSRGVSAQPSNFCLEVAGRQASSLLHDFLSYPQGLCRHTVRTWRARAMRRDAPRRVAPRRDVAKERPRRARLCNTERFDRPVSSGCSSSGRHAPRAAPERNPAGPPRRGARVSAFSACSFESPRRLLL